MVYASAALMRSLRQPARALDEATLDEIASRVAGAAEPVAVVGSWIEVARDEGDTTGVCKRLYELGAAVVRYAVALGLADVARALEGANAPNPLAQHLQKAARLSDGSWCELGRMVEAQLTQQRRPLREKLAWLRKPPVSGLMASRNRFAHDGAPGDDAPDRCLALLELAAGLLELPLVCVMGLDPLRADLRMGAPLRPGVWRKHRGDLPDTAAREGAFAVLDDDWLPVTPWLPQVDGRLALPDAPHAPRQPWRSFDPDQGEHRVHIALDEAVKRLAGADPNAPQPMTERPPLVGRDAAIACIRRAAEEAAAGRVRVLLLTGPLGIGRTRLLREVAEALPGFGYHRVLEGACSPERRSLLRPLRSAVEGQVPAAARAIEALLAGDEVLGGSQTYDAALEAVEEALIAAGVEGPLGLLLSDLQWADEATLRVVRMLTERANRGAHGRVCVIADARDGPDHSALLQSLIAQVEQDVGSGATRVALEAMPVHASRAVVRGVAPIDERVEERVVAGAAGVPFFIVQPLLSWGETGALAWREQRWRPVDDAVLEKPVPGVLDLVTARLDSFFERGSPTRHAAEVLLALVSLAASGLSTEHVMSAARRLEISTSSAEAVLEVLTEAGLLNPLDERREHACRLGMVREAVVAQAAQKPWFARVRRVLLETLEVNADPAIDGIFLADGFAALGEKERAAHWLRVTVRRLLRVGAYATALPLTGRLTELATTRGARLEARLWAAEALHGGGQHQEAEEWLVATVPLAAGDLEGAVRLRLLRIEVEVEIGGHERALTRGIIGLADRTGRPTLGVQARLTVADLLRGQVGIDLLARAEERLGRVPESEVAALAYRLYALRTVLLYEVRRPAEEWRRAALQAREAAEAAGSVFARLTSAGDQAVIDIDAGHPDTALGLLDDIIAEARQHHLRTVERTAMSNRVGCLFRLGRLEDTVAAAQGAATAFREAGSWRHEATVLSMKAGALLKLERLPAALDAINDSLSLKRRGRDVRIAFTLLRRAEIRRRLGDVDGARSDAEEALRCARGEGNEEDARQAEAVLKGLGEEDS